MHSVPLDRIVPHSPKIFCTIMTRDEPAILRECIEHHIRQGVYGFVINSHVNIEENREVFKDYPQVKHVYEEPNPHHFPQDEWRTRLARMAVELGAHWIVPADSDEFWYGLRHLRRIRGPIRSIQIYRVFNHFLTQEILSEREFRREMLPYHGSPHCTKTIHRAHEGIRIVHCNHVPINYNHCLRDPKGFVVHHYPLRSFERFIIKATTGTMRPGHQRWRWREEYRKGKLREVYERMISSPEFIAEGLEKQTVFELKEV